ncbi:TraY domain-containing protein [Aeromonas salmonicida]|uniref:TraY domain-containing protein n=1 Tax=Aeromonas salmonicida TaxID=645 RepID=UPI000B3FF342|nr:TraY domain-containing protein [Aeromonas salmonicida]
MPEKYRETSTVVSLNPESNRLLTESAKRSGRTKVQEASIRLRDHLLHFSEIATEGKRFEEKIAD